MGREALDAESAANALQDVAPNVDVRWASRFEQADVWIDTHHDLAALLLDVEADDQHCGAFLTSFRRRGIDAAIVLITPEGSSPPGRLLSAGADECAEKGASFSRSRTIHSLAPWFGHMRREAVGITCASPAKAQHPGNR